MGRKSQKTRIAEAAEMRNSGMSVDEIAKEMGVTKDSVYRFISFAIKKGLTERSYRRATDERLKFVAKVYNETHDYHAVADAAGVGYFYATELVRLSRNAGYADPHPSISGNVSCMKSVMSKSVMAWVRKQTHGDDTDMHTVGHILMDLYERELET